MTPHEENEEETNARHREKPRFALNEDEELMMMLMAE